MKLKKVLPFLFLLMMFIFPLYLATTTTSFEMNSCVKDVVWGWIFIVLLTCYQYYRGSFLRNITRNTWWVFLFFCILFFWILQDINFWNRNQFWLYLGAAGLFFVLSSLKEGSAFSVENVLIYKLLIVGGISLFLSIYIYTLTPEEFGRIKASPPVYIHIRHFNHDTFLAFIVSIGLLLDKKMSKGFVYLLIFLLLYSTLWSYARGEILGILIFISVLVISRKIKIISEHTIMLTLIIVFSALIIFATGVDHYIIKQWNNPGGIDNVRILTSNRTTIWLKSISVVLKGGILPILSGYGPGSYRSFGLFNHMVHPHSLYVQVFFEFGLLGLIGLGNLMFYMIRECYFCLMKTDNLFVAVIAAGVIGTFVYGGVTGLHYYAIPLMTITLMFALVVRPRLQSEYQG